jgi:hypothetical protein
MKNNLFIIIKILICCVFMLNGCSSEAKITKLTNVEKFEYYSKLRLDKVLVVGIPRIEKNRKDFENHFSRKLKRRGTSAIPSYEVIPNMKDLNKDSIKNAAIKMEAGAVLTTSVVGVDDKSVVVPGQRQLETVATPRGVFTFAGPHISGPYVKEYINVRLKTGLFETQSEKLLWNASSKIIAPGTEMEAIKDFSKAILNQLQLDGYVR